MIVGQGVSGSRVLGSLKLWKYSCKHANKAKRITWWKQSAELSMFFSVCLEEGSRKGSFRYSLGCLLATRMGLRPGALPIKRQRAHPAGSQLIALWGNTFPCIGLSVYSFVLLKHMCQWHSETPSFQHLTLHRWGFFCCITRDVHTGQLPCVVCQTWGHGAAWVHMGDWHTAGADLTLSFYVSKRIVPFSAWLHCAFPGDSSANIQWAEVFGLLFPVFGTVMVFANPQVWSLILALGQTWWSALQRPIMLFCPESVLLNILLMTLKKTKSKYKIRK